jgi:hypothetical protein
VSSARLIFVAGILLALAPNARPDPEPTVAALRDRVLKVEDAGEARAAYRALFKRLDAAGLQDLTKDTDTGIALQAAWEAHRKLIKRPRPVPDREDEMFDPAEAAKFLAFLKDRTKAPVPDWWATLIVDSDLVIGKFQAFPAIRRGHEPVGPKVRKSKIGHLVPKGAELERDGERLVYSAGGRLVAFDPEYTNRPLAWDRFTAILGDKQTVVARYPDIPLSFWLVAFPGGGGKPIWRAGVWALYEGDLATSGGEGSDRVELRIQGGLVYVFGASFAGMFLEAFEEQTGKCQFRFNSIHSGKYLGWWEWRPE